MVQMQTYLKVADNTGAKELMCFRVLGGTRKRYANIGDTDYYTLFQRFCQEGAESFFAAEAEDENAAADLL